MIPGGMIPAGMIKVFVEGIGILGPGLDGWPASRAVLTGQVRYEPAPFMPPPVAMLPPAERRRAGTAIRLAIRAGTEALARSGHDPVSMAMVFTSSSGDGDTVHDILSILATDSREVSPTRFHNSVHNAPAGYWAVATGSREPSTSLCAFDDSFSAGLLDAAVQATVDNRPVTLTAYDLPYPEPLQTVRPIEGLFAAALVLTPTPTSRAIAALTILPGRSGKATTMMHNGGMHNLGMPNGGMPNGGMPDARLERLRLGNPAARSLPLLAAIARARAATIRVEAAAGTSAEIVVEPW